MEIVPTNYTVADYCADLNTNKIVVNREYQRSDKVWPLAAKSFLIETILLSYPVPKIALFQRIDVKTRKAVKEIVDGQQRSMAILDFYNDKLRLSKILESDDLAGMTYSELSPDMQGRFLNYSLSVDLFVAATNDQIREIFKRINSYTVPLNPEETRHAIYQGSFKWFMYSLTKECGELFDQIGVFNGKALVRMMDAKLLTEIAYALLNGITTTNKQVLDSLYKKYDESFPESDDFRAGIVGAMRTIDRWKALHNGPLARSYMMYSLLLAVMHLSQPVPKLMVYYEIQNPIEIDDDQAIIALSSLADAVEREDPPKELSDFVRACASSTNGSNQRVTRFKTFCSAIALRR